MPQTQRKTPTPSEALTKLGLTTPLHLLHHYPKQHQVIHRKKMAHLQPGETVMTIGYVIRHRIKEARGGKLVVQTWTLQDKTGRHRLLCTQFHKARLPYTSMQWRRQQGQTYAQGSLVVVSGPVKHDSYAGCLAIHGEVSPISPKQIASLPSLVLNPVYRLSKGLDMATLQSRIQAALNTTPLQDPIPAKFRQRHRLIELSEALAQIHFPASQVQLEAARRRLVFDEFFYLHMALLVRRGQVPQQVENQGLSLSLLKRFKTNLPFALTGAQQRTLTQVLDDQALGYGLNHELLRVGGVPQYSGQGQLCQNHFKTDPAGQWLDHPQGYGLTQDLIEGGIVPQFVQGRRRCSAKSKSRPCDQWLDTAPSQPAPPEVFVAIGFTVGEERRRDRGDRADAKRAAKSKAGSIQRTNFYQNLCSTPAIAESLAGGVAERDQKKQSTKYLLQHRYA